MSNDIETEVRRRTRRIAAIAAAVIVVILTGAGITVWRIGTDQPTATGPAATAGPSSAVSPPAIASPSTSAGPPELGKLTWMDVRGMAVPVSASAGPRVLAAGRASGFSHDPAGAVLAAVHITVRADAIVGPAVFRPTIRQQVTGIDADNLAGTVESDYETSRQAAGVDPGDPLPETHATLAGYRLDSYDQGDTFLRLLASSPGRDAQGTVYVDFRVEVRWIGGDWRLVAPPGGSWSNATGQVASAFGYTPFPGRR